MNQFKYVDMHFHGSFLSKQEAFLESAEKLSIASLCVNVDTAVNQKDIRFNALGLHPWWVTYATNEEIRSKLNEFMNLSSEYKYFGEIGLDYSDRYKKGKRKQFKVLAMLIELIMWSDVGKSNFKPCVSIHSRCAENFVLDLIDTFDAGSQFNVVMHAFSGSQPELNNAIKLGCYFSYGLRQANSGKGRDYIKKIPFNKLLIESDLPKKAGDYVLGPDFYLDILEQTVLKIYEIREGKDNMDFDEFKKAVVKNSMKILSGE